MRGSDFIFDCVNLLYYKCHKICLKRIGLYIDSPHSIKKKQATRNQRNDHDKCFQYTAAVMLNHGKTESYPERVSNIKPFINNYNLEGINYPSIIEDWKRLEKNNPTIAFIVGETKENEEWPTCISKINSNSKNK